MWNVILTAIDHINGEVQVTIYLVTVKMIKFASRSSIAGVIFVYHVR